MVVELFMLHVMSITSDDNQLDCNFVLSVNICADTIAIWKRVKSEFTYQVYVPAELGWMSLMTRSPLELAAVPSGIAACPFLYQLRAYEGI